MITIEEILASEVRALSWKQPFAELMICGKEETRTWNTKYRGLVLICASAIIYTPEDLEQISGRDQIDRIRQKLGAFWPGAVKTGKAIAIGRLVHSQPMLPHCEAENRAFVRFRKNLYVHIYEDVRLIKEFPWKGIQGWKKLTDEEKKLIQLL